MVSEDSRNYVRSSQITTSPDYEEARSRFRGRIDSVSTHVGCFNSCGYAREYAILREIFD